MTVASFFGKYSVGCILNYVRLIITREISCISIYTVIVFPFIIWFYGGAIVIIRGWGCGFGNRREHIVAWSDNREETFFYSPRIYSRRCLFSGYLTP
jgi:hypothetical protein